MLVGRLLRGSEQGLEDLANDGCAAQRGQLTP
jgi:hypothetical protein